MLGICLTILDTDCFDQNRVDWIVAGITLHIGDLEGDIHAVGYLSVDRVLVIKVRSRCEGYIELTII